ncbi:MAG: hypothetical protein LBH87_01505, partial [Coriobacteriales bacterium]|nr:hypothetical protein [Coriobacteriales bacterium]
KSLSQKKFLNILLAIFLIAGLSIPVGLSSKAFAAPSSEPAGYVAVDLEIHTLGDGYLYEPVKVPFYEGENIAQVTDRLLGGSSNYTKTGSLTDSFYLASVKMPRDITLNVPQFILDANGPLDPGPTTKGKFLGEFDFSFWSGWMITQNNWYIDASAANFKVKDGDVIRWQFTVYGYGEDLGSAFMGTPMYDPANKDSLIMAVAGVNSASNKEEVLAKPGVLNAYNNALAALTNLTVSQADVDSALATLNAALNPTPTTPPTPPSSIDISKQLNATLATLVSTVPSPDFGTLSGEWTVLALARAGYSVPDGYYEGYLDRIEGMLSTKESMKLHKNKATENQRLILALSALGKDCTNFRGYNLVEPMADMSWFNKQGINAYIFYLISMDTDNYGEVTNSGFADETTRQKVVDYILSKERISQSGGGWSLTGAADPDITAMAMQALTPYRSQPAVADAIDRALNWLSGVQGADGTFYSWGSYNLESTAQVTVALTALGIDPATDSRFVKAEGNTITGLLSFYVEGGGFKHVATGERDGMATDQGSYALVAYERFTNGKNRLYDMTDAFTSEPTIPIESASIILDAPDKVSGKAGTSFNMLVKATGFPEGGWKLMDGVIDIPSIFSVEGVTTSSRLGGGTLSWNVDTGNQLRFVYTDTSLEGIGLSGTEFPAELMSISLKLKTDIDVAVMPDAEICVGGLTLKTTSYDPAFIFNISKATRTVGFTAPVTIAVSVRELFTGDGIDLIPADKRAVAVTVDGISAGQSIGYKGAELFYSPEFTGKYGVATYVLFTTSGEPGADLADFANYSTPDGAAQAVKFGDSDKNNIINAQDALDVISGWLRQTPVSTDGQILTYNVTSDSRINTYDALGIMENYVHGSEFAILGK